MPSYSSFLSLAAVVGLASAHGRITSPTPRNAGTEFTSVCGAQLDSLVTSDPYGNIQGEEQVAAGQSDYDASKCNLWQCKGYQFADNSDNVQTYTAGQTIDMTVEIRAPHTGTANVTVVDLSTNSVVGEAMQYWSVYASNSATIPTNNTQFSITMPDVSSTCGTAGTCVIAWVWDAASIDQTYTDCIDFTMGGSGSSSNTTEASSAAPVSSTAAAVASSAVASSAVASSSVAATSAVAVASSTNVAAVATSAAAVTTSAPATTSSAAADDDECDDGETSTASAAAAEATGADEGDDCDDGEDTGADTTAAATSAAETSVAYATETAVATSVTTVPASSASAAAPAVTSSSPADEGDDCEDEATTSVVATPSSTLATSATSAAAAAETSASADDECDDDVEARDVQNIANAYARRHARDLAARHH